MRIGIVLGAVGLALGAVSFALCFFSPIAAGLTGLAAGIVAFICGALEMKSHNAASSPEDEATSNAVPVPQTGEDVQ
ncbi:MAG: hypothetical protein LKI93_03630 [Bifidobacteriaceae bacterium]|jgi:di/tricarboxylate transporter|nr:hypothetical protein [Bifidobacteriaceae bacterium]MCI1915313.1 hypothetical protein [Bifidobacteriaceae bacterium]